MKLIFIYLIMKTFGKEIKRPTITDWLMTICAIVGTIIQVLDFLK